MVSPQTPNLAQEAHDYAAMGWAVFPLQAGQKKPLGFTTGLHAASADVELTVARWAGRAPLPMREKKTPDEWMPPQVLAGPRCNIGLRTGAASGLWVLDIDGEVGIASLLDLAARFGRLPQTVRQHTGGGGGQLFYAWPGVLPWGVEIRNGVSKFADHLDVRGTGGYVVLPPSLHPSGRRYAWADGCAPWEIEPARAPWWLLRLVAPPPAPAPTAAYERRTDGADSAQRYAGGALFNACEEIARAPKGQRDVTLHRNAYGIGRLVAGGLVARDVARQDLIAAGLKMGAGDPEYSEKAVAWKVDHAFRRAEHNPRRAP